MRGARRGAARPAGMPACGCDGGGRWGCRCPRRRVPTGGRRPWRRWWCAPPPPRARCPPCCCRTGARTRRTRGPTCCRPPSCPPLAMPSLRSAPPPHPLPPTPAHYLARIQFPEQRNASAEGQQRAPLTSVLTEGALVIPCRICPALLTRSPSAISQAGCSVSNMTKLLSGPRVAVDCDAITSAAVAKVAPQDGWRQRWWWRGCSPTSGGPPDTARTASRRCQATPALLTSRTAWQLSTRPLRRVRSLEVTRISCQHMESLAVSTL